VSHVHFAEVHDDNYYACVSADEMARLLLADLVCQPALVGNPNGWFHSGVGRVRGHPRMTVEVGRPMGVPVETTSRIPSRQQSRMVDVPGMVDVPYLRIERRRLVFGRNLEE